MSSHLGLLERENAAVLNAALMPLASALLPQCERTFHRVLTAAASTKVRTPLSLPMRCLAKPEGVVAMVMQSQQLMVNHQHCCPPHPPD